MSLKKNVLMVALVLTISAIGSAQEKKKIEEIAFKVEGVCGMCEDRIETALDVKGIKLGEWDLRSKICRVVYKPSVITEDEIHNLLTAVGHDTEKFTATEEKYNTVHSCCKYRDMDGH